MPVDPEVLVRGLIGGMPLDDFNQKVRERQTRKFEAALSAQTMRELYTVARLEALLSHETFVMPYVDIFDEIHLRRLADLQHKTGKSGLEVIAENFRQGSTIRVRNADAFDAVLNSLAVEVRRRFVGETDINVYLTPRGKKGFPPHFDITDVFILQCSGTKEWRIFPDYANRIELPLQETNWDPDAFKPLGVCESFTLCEGDVLYLPRGAMHQAFCTERESLHLTVSLAPVTFADVLSKAIRTAAQTELELRRRIPWPADGEKRSYEPIVRMLKEHLAGWASDADLTAVLKAHHTVLLEEPKGDSHGALTAAIASLRDGNTGA